MTDALLAILVVELGLVVVWALREQRSANHYRGEALTLQGDRLDVELVSWARSAGRRQLVVTSLDAERDPEREQDGEESNGFHASRIAGGPDGS